MKNYIKISIFFNYISPIFGANIVIFSQENKFKMNYGLKTSANLCKKCNGRVAQLDRASAF